MHAYQKVPTTEDGVPNVKYSSFSDYAVDAHILKGQENYNDKHIEFIEYDDVKNKVAIFRNLAIVACVAFAVLLILSLLSVGTKSLYSSLTISKPNFIFILADDVGWNSFGYENYDLAFATPYITKLAQNGIVLSNYYSQEVCTPARASLLTGRYPINTGIQYGAIQATSEFSLHIEETLISNILQENGYINYILGKWNLGHYNPKYLPTARGFDYFLGFLDGHNYYWSKRDPLSDTYYDFMYSNSECYNMYNGSDMNTYSTTLYANKAVDAIKSHDFESYPMFMYFAPQAAHDPFTDYNGDYSDGLPESYVGTSRYRSVMNNVIGGKRQQYALSLMMLDDAVNSIYEAIVSVGQLDNTYIIVTSDNGGCYNGGGKNGPLRGSKGTLFEGGTKVDAFIYSPLLSEYAGTTYNGIMHVSDWFPTLLSLADIEYKGAVGFALDGYDQSKAMIKGSNYNKRQYLVYNMYYNVTDEEFDLYNGSSLAVRNSQFKLVHGYTDNAESIWYDAFNTTDNDDVIEFEVFNACSQKQSRAGGTFSTMLFDLENDPYETTNLYGQAAYANVQAELYTMVDYVAKQSAQCVSKAEIAEGSYSYFESNEYFIQPWSFPSARSKELFPVKCSSKHIFSP